jgi:hypothetical protein
LFIFNWSKATYKVKEEELNQSTFVQSSKLAINNHNIKIYIFFKFQRDDM